MIFETERLRARDWRPEDAEAAYGIYRDDDVVRVLGSVPQPVESMEAMRERVGRWIANRTDDGYGFWALETHEGTLVGATLVKPLPDAAEVEIGWHLGKAHWGRGYATESGTAAARYAFEHQGLDVVYAVVVRDNEPSLAVARRLGMTYEGSTDRYYGKELELFSLRTTKAPA
ncbi:MAG TPA: GNAT family N-acetyltransferase [Frankiaceae bacterium]|jgi:RimJ/RimL family protein N-acetyltransferase|nr:GNAT family N-acetyltransferase [Frankiaceae bacterium]